MNLHHIIEASLALFLWIGCISCTNSSSQKRIKTEQKNSITCDAKGCQGTYIGPEFINGEDIAHQFSNTMSKQVGDELKQLYSNGNYAKVDFNAISMSTKGMGTGKVTYTLSIPFKRVNEKCEAYTSFDHVGGWNHSPALTERKMQLEKILIKGEKLDISELKKTEEGLQEYWIQWKNKDVQHDCAKVKSSL